MTDFKLQTDMTAPQRGRLMRAVPQASEDTGFAQHLYPERAVGTEETAVHNLFGGVEHDAAARRTPDVEEARAGPQSVLWQLSNGVEKHETLSREIEPVESSLFPPGTLFQHSAPPVAIHCQSGDGRLAVSVQMLPVIGAQGSPGMTPQEGPSAASVSGVKDRVAKTVLTPVSGSGTNENSAPETIYRFIDGNNHGAPVTLHPTMAHQAAHSAPVPHSFATQNVAVPGTSNMQTGSEKRSLARIARGRASDTVPVQVSQPSVSGHAVATALATMRKTALVQPAAALQAPESAEHWRNLALRERDSFGLPASPTANQGGAAIPTIIAAQAPQPSATAQIAQMLAKAKGDRFEITLTPEELGRVRIHLQQSEVGLQVLIATERPETLDFLRKNIATLSRELSDLGFSGARFEFEHGHQDKQQRKRRAASDLPAQILPVLGADLPPSLAPQSQTNGLDLRF